VKLGEKDLKRIEPNERNLTELEINLQLGRSFVFGVVFCFFIEV
jgi:hypothetical protein